MGALNIKDTEVADKARKLARLQRKSITEAVSEALDQALRTAVHKSGLDHEKREREVDAALKRIRDSIPADAPSYEQVMEDMYDEFGAPK
jgi:hypothetical protein